MTEINSWRVVPTSGNVPVARHCHSAVAYENAMYIFGGYSSDSNRTGIHRNDLCKLDFNTLEWSTCLHYSSGTPPAFRHSHTAVIYNKHMYIFGGIGNSGEVQNDIHRYNFERNSWEELSPQRDVPVGRWGHSATVIYEDLPEQASMIVFGGYANNFMNDLWQYHFASNTWKAVKGFGHMPKPRQFHVSVAYNNQLYVMGGFGMVNNMMDCFQFNFQSYVWVKCSNPLSPRRGHSGVIYNGGFYIFGGFDNYQKNDINYFNLDQAPTMSEWEIVEDMNGSPPSARHFHSAVVYKGSMYIFGGFARKQNHNDLHRFSFEEITVPQNDRSLPFDMRSLLNNQKYSDIVFRVDGQLFYAHRNILFCRSDHFSAMIDNGMRESQQSVIEIQDMPYSVFMTVMEFLYTDTVNIDPDLVVETLIASDRFLLPKLKIATEKFLTSALSLDNIVSLFQLATAYDAQSLVNKCLEFLDRCNKQQIDVSHVRLELESILQTEDNTKVAATIMTTATPPIPIINDTAPIRGVEK